MEIESGISLLTAQTLWYIVRRLQVLPDALSSAMSVFANSTLRPTIFLSACALFALAALFRSDERTRAQAGGPVLISQAESTRGIAFDSVTHQREPFSAVTPICFGSDAATRIMLFAMNLHFQADEPTSAVTADAEDSEHHSYPLTVEYMGSVPNQPWTTSIIVRLNPEMADLGDVLIRIKYHGLESNRIRLGLGPTCGGPPDDEGAVPAPGSEISPPPPSPGATATNLTTDDVRRIIAQAVSAAVQIGHPVSVIVTDREANFLGTFTMTGAPATTTIRSVGATGRGLEGTVVPTALAATSKAGTGALFSTTGNAFSTRTAGFIIQEHFPPGVHFQSSGPLYGVQFSSLPCSDIKKPGLPLGLSADSGGLPIYKDGVAVGGVGIEGDGLYTVDRDPTDFDQPFEELIAASAERGFEPPALIRGDNILVDGIRLAYLNVNSAPSPATIPFGSLPGAVDPLFPIRGAQTSVFTAAMVGGIAGEVDTRFFPFVGSPTVTADSLTSVDVSTVIAHAAQQANITRAAIRQPLGSNARVSIAVVDTKGVVLGVFRQTDAPVFGFDVSVQKARTAAFYSATGAAASLRTVGFGSYVDRAADDGLKLDGSVAFTDRAGGFLHRPFFPDGIDNTAPGPFSTGIGVWSVFNVGLQLDLI